jgi:LysM repeat protein
MPDTAKPPYSEEISHPPNEQINSLVGETGVSSPETEQGAAITSLFTPQENINEHEPVGQPGPDLAKNPKTPTSTQSTEPPQTYTIEDGDTLTTLADESEKDFIEKSIETHKETQQ